MAESRRTVAELTCQEYSGGLQALEPDLTPTEHKMLKAHYQAPEHTITARQLAQALGWSGFEPSNTHYGRLARKVGDVLAVGMSKRGRSMSWLSLVGPATSGIGSY